MAVRRIANAPWLIALVVVAALALAVGFGIARAADQRLAEADLALQKAAALVEASQTGGVSERAQRRFDRAVARALENIADARANVLKAQEAVDNDVP